MPAAQVDAEALAGVPDVRGVLGAPDVQGVQAYRVYRSCLLLLL